jgi:hypothetical protein
MTKPSVKLNEDDMIMFVLSAPSIEEACRFECEAVRNSYHCPNTRRCGLQFNREIGPVLVKELRTNIWRKLNRPVGIGVTQARRQRLIDQLMSMRVIDTTDGQPRIEYKLNGKKICKSFYKVLSCITIS